MSRLDGMRMAVDRRTDTLRASAPESNADGTIILASAVALRVVFSACQGPRDIGRFRDHGVADESLGPADRDLKPA
eukprot:CAMPEP_0170186930 /NCGR_PEP_ID=MMETSP0040_2-20121228/40497_1 /TAXON_ID=641309 /ORGANISM="Lotharella oceanica, Strain CCMP622" /LENGTH=75 /DNA_ID=CAMNT_0010433817 /DNA_START=301 /DNA_END=524 /DNA_ORIENTATION=+